MNSCRAMTVLLSRSAFHTAVLARSGGRCVLCAAPATEAHHILERKLFADGGYVLNNGAAVCNPCHIRCETTQVSVEDVRKASGITQIVVPPGFDAALRYDKWGNIMHPNGLRAPGPLAQDTGMMRALAQGGVRQLLMPADTNWASLG